MTPDTLPFPVGSTWYGGATPDATALGADNFLGKEFIVNDDNPTDGTSRSSRQRKLKCVRNTAAVALLPKYLATYESVAGKIGQTVDGLHDVEATERPAGFVDEYLPSGGVIDDDVFYIVVEGPAVGKVSRVAAEAVITLNDRLIGATAVTSGSTSAGRVKTIDLTGATTPLANQIMHSLGRALSARTTADTGADILIDVWINKW